MCVAVSFCQIEIFLIWESVINFTKMFIFFLVECFFIFWEQVAIVICHYYWILFAICVKAKWD